MRKNLVMCACFGPGLLLFAQPVYNQSLRTPNAVSSYGSGAYSQNFTDVFAIAANPAGLGSVKGFSAGVAAERRFLLAELNQYHAAIYYGMENAGVGLQLQYAGFSAFNESQAGLSYGRNLGKVQIGGQFNYHRISIAGYGSAGVISADLAVIWQLTEKVRAGIQAVNIVPRFFGAGKSEKYSSVYKLGLGYELSGKCFLSAEIYKETRKVVNAYLFLQYQVIERLLLRLGFNSDTGRPFAGVGWKIGDLRLLITGSYHPDLGLTPGMMLIFEKPKSN